MSIVLKAQEEEKLQHCSKVKDRVSEREKKEEKGKKKRGFTTVSTCANVNQQPEVNHSIEVVALQVQI